MTTMKIFTFYFLYLNCFDFSSYYRCFRYRHLLINPYNY